MLRHETGTLDDEQRANSHVRKDRALLLHGGMFGVEGSKCSDCSPLIKPFVAPFTSNERAREVMSAFRGGKGAEPLCHAPRFVERNQQALAN